MDTEDFKTFAEAAPLIKPYFSQAWADKVKFKGTVAQRESEFYKQLPKGVFQADILNRGFELFVKENGEMIKRQSQSILAEQQRTDNARVLQDQKLYADDNINQAVRDRIASERELVAATEELKTAFVGFDTWLNKRTAETYRAWVNVFTGKDDYESKDRFNNKQSGVLLNPRLNFGATRERVKRDDMLASRPISLLAPQQESNPAFGELGKALLTFKEGLSPRGVELLSGKQSQAPAAAVQALKQTFNNHNETHVDASVTFGDVKIEVPSGIGDPAALTDYISTHLEENFARHHKGEMQKLYRQAMIDNAERRK